MGVISAEKPKQLIGFRHAQALMMFFGVMLASFTRVNMSLAIVAMTDKTQDDTFDWSLQTQNIVLSSYKWGFIVLLSVSGELVRICGALPVYMTAMGVDTVANLLLPTAGTYGGWQAVCACRSIQGLAHGLQMPTKMYLFSRWVPKDEKGRLMCLIFSGSNLGSAIQLLTSGYVADAWGWQGIFYVDGILGLIWCIVYFFIGADSPQTSKLISQKERDYIQASLQQEGEQKKLKTPWKAILTSGPVWAVVIAGVGFAWGYWTLLTQVPIYMKRVLGIDIKRNGVLSALPYFTSYIISFPFGYITDYSLRRNWVSVNVSRKLSNTIALLGPATALIAVCYCPADITILIILLCCTVGLTVGYLTGEGLMYLDMSPNFVSSIYGFSLFVSGIVSLNAPIVSGLMIQDETDAAGWRNVFFLTAGFYVISWIIFLTLGSTEKQPWNEPLVENTDAEEDVKK